MNKEVYLKELKKEIEVLPEGEQREIIADYAEHFRVGVQQGKSEDEISLSLGNPGTIGKSIRIDSILDGIEVGSAVTVLRAVLATMSLGFFNIVVVLGPFVAIVAVVASLWTAALAFGLSGVALVLGVAAAPIFPASITLGGFSPAFVIFAGIAVAALGLLSLIGMWELTKWVVRAVGRYVRLNARIVTNRR